MADHIPPDVQAFISDSIGSIAELELLLMLADDPATTWQVETIARQLYVTPAATETVLARMTSRGLLSHSAEGYRYAPQSTALEATVKALKEEYQKRRVRIIELIYAGPTEKYQSFADAFRLRKNPKAEP